MAKTKEITICNYDIVFNKTHKPSSVYKYFQQIATDDLDTFGIDSHTLFDRGMAFVLARMKTVFYEPLFCYDILTLSSCHRRTKGVSFIRDYVLMRNGEKVAETSSYWVLIDINTRKICRPSVLSTSDRFDPLASFEIEDRFAFPEGIETQKLPYRVVFSDIDENCHMNNTRYPDICLDIMGGIKENEYVSEIRIDYLNESRLSDEIEVETVKMGDTNYFRALNKTRENKCFDAIIKIKNI